MLLNNLSQSFSIYMSPNTFFPEVVKLWEPAMKRLFLPYLTLEDLFNSQITAISFPSVSSQTITQNNQNYEIHKKVAMQLDQQMNKSLTLTVKLSESYMTYFMARQQFDLFLKVGENAKDLYFPPISVTIHDDGGFENITYTYYQLTPTNLSDFDLSYAARPGSFNTFTWEFTYNYFEIWYRDIEGKRKCLNINKDDGMNKHVGLIKTTELPESHDIISRHRNLYNKK